MSTLPSKPKVTLRSSLYGEFDLDELVDRLCHSHAPKPQERDLYNAQIAILRLIEIMRAAPETNEPPDPTPEMIQQGIWAWQHNERYSTAEDVRATYIAMRRMEGRTEKANAGESRAEFERDRGFVRPTAPAAALPGPDLACEGFVPDPHSRFCDRCGYPEREHRRAKNGEGSQT